VGVPSENQSSARPATAFWVLGVLLITIGALGGSSRADVAPLIVLRPLSILAAAYAIYTLNRRQWRLYWPIFLLLAAVLTLLVIHLIPLPPAIWQSLPGRGIIEQIDSLLNVPGRWRPLSMVPSGTVNALYSMAVPIAVFALAAQLGPADHVRLLLLLIMIFVVSGLLGLIQAVGADVYIFDKTTENTGLFANRNHQGVLLAMLLPMLTVAAFWSNPILSARIAVIAAGALALITVPLIVVTGSRAGLIALIMAVALVPVIGVYRKKGTLPLRGRSVAIAYGIAALFFAVLIWMTIFASRDTALMRFEQIDEDLRYPVWVSIVDILPNYLPWGSGIGSYVEVYQILEPDRLLRPSFSNHAHNEWLEIALTAGIPGIVLLACAVLLYCRGIWRSLHTSGPLGAFSRLGLGLILILAFASTFDYPIRTPIMASVLAIATVWACSYKRFGNEDWRG
jgi:O-antigen ligase